MNKPKKHQQEVEAEVSEPVEPDISTQSGSRVEYALKVYQSIMDVPNEVAIGSKKYMMYPKSSRHLAMIGERLLRSAMQFDELRRLGKDLFDGKVPDAAKVLELLTKRFHELMDVILDVFAIMLCDVKRPSSEDLGSIREQLYDELTIPAVLLVFATFMEQNSLSPFVRIFRGAAKEISLS